MRTVIKALIFILNILPESHKRKTIIVSILLIVNSGIEILGLGAIFPVFALLLEENIVQKYNWTRWLYTTFKMTDDRSLILLVVVALFAIFLIKNILSLWISRLQSSFALSLFRVFMIRLHSLYYQRGFLFFKATNSNIIMRDLRVATEHFSQHIVLGTLNLFNEIIVLSAIILSIAIYNINILGLLLLTVSPPFLFFYLWVRNRSIKLGKIKNRIEPIITKNIFQSIHGFVDILISGSEEVFRKRIDENVKELIDVNIRTNVYNLAPTKVIETALMLAIAIIVTFGLYFLPSKTDLIKLLGVFAIAGYRIMPSINRMMIALNGLNQEQWTFDILSPLISMKSNIYNSEQKIIFNHSLQLNNISFSYPNSSKNILESFSLTIIKGEVVGLTGLSGAGKTTIMNILLGFLQPSQGTYKIDDTILTEEYLRSFYKKVGYVQQQVYLIDSTIAENIAFGITGDNIDFAKLSHVLKKASLWDLIESLPDGINTMIGENGTKLSGGQRQRIGIARALYYDAEILFFDEATSSLDSQTEQDISNAINTLSDGSLTIVIIAHRMSTLESCDRIIEIRGTAC